MGALHLPTETLVEVVAQIWVLYSGPFYRPMSIRLLASEILRLVCSCSTSSHVVHGLLIMLKSALVIFEVLTVLLKFAGLINLTLFLLWLLHLLHTHARRLHLDLLLHAAIILLVNQMGAWRVEKCAFRIVASCRLT